MHSTSIFHFCCLHALYGNKNKFEKQKFKQEKHFPRCDTVETRNHSIVAPSVRAQTRDKQPLNVFENKMSLHQVYTLIVLNAITCNINVITVWKTFGFLFCLLPIIFYFYRIILYLCNGISMKCLEEIPSAGLWSLFFYIVFIMFMHKFIRGERGKRKGNIIRLAKIIWVFRVLTIETDECLYYYLNRRVFTIAKQCHHVNIGYGGFFFIVVLISISPSIPWS